MTSTQKTIRRSKTGRVNRKVGDEAESVAIEALDRLGVKLLEHIKVGYKVIFAKMPDGIRANMKKPLKAFPLDPVSGDIRGVLPGGVSVHAECKFRTEKLCWSDFEPHQIEHLDKHAEAGAVSLVVWVISLWPKECFVLRWPVDGLRKGKALIIDEARRIEITGLISQALDN